jgi:uncharacterized protein
MLEGFVLPGVPLPVFWSFLAIAVVIQGISKSGFAGGAGIVSLPLMMLVMPAARVAAVLLPILILADMNAIYHHRRNKDWAAIRALYVPAVAGILAGAFVWWWAGETGIDRFDRWIKMFVGFIAVLFAAFILVRERALDWVAEKRPTRSVSWFAGIAAGFTSTIAHAAGPIVSLYMFSLNLGKSLFVGTVAWTFTLINLTKLPFYAGVGLIDPKVLGFAIVLLPCIPIGSFLGHWMHHRISEQFFNRIILILTVLAAAQLLTGVNVIYAAARLFG